MKKHLTKCAGVFLFALLFTTLFFCVSASAAEYPDAKGHWAEKAINKWSDSGILTGYSNGNFGPNDNVTRAQLSAVLYRIWGCQPKIGHTYSDLSPSAWYYEALSTMNSYGVALSRGNNIYPDEALTREEAFYMVAKAFNIGAEYDGIYEIKSISDASKIDSSFSYRISHMFQFKYLKGSSDGAFRPKSPVSRAEVMQVIDNIFDVCISEPGSYTLVSNQVALVTSGDVSINYTPIPNYNYTNMGKAYLMSNTVNGGVTFTNSDFGKGKSLMLEVRGISENGLAWTQDGIYSASDKSAKLSDPKQVPDLRFAGGIGTKRSPYLIETAEQFRLLGNTRFIAESGSSVYFELLNDIELPGNQEPILLRTIRAHLNGNGYTVSYNMKKDIIGDSIDDDQSGLFDTWSGSCSDLTLSGTIDLTVKETATYTQYSIGGFAGNVSGVVTDCNSNMNIRVSYSGKKQNEFFIGGLAGTVSSGSFINCTAAGSVSAAVSATTLSVNVGGLVGTSSPDSYSNPLTTGSGVPAASKRVISYIGCSSTATVSVQGGYHSVVGGLIGNLTYPTNDSTLTGEAYGIMENCWSTAEVSSSGAGFQSDCGGIVGHLEAGTIRSSWSKPMITISEGSFKNMGGISGAVYEKGTVSDCWGDVSGLELRDDGRHYGSIAGRMAGSLSNCFTLGTAKFAPENAISYASWTDGTVTACLDMTKATQTQKDNFYKTCGWDFTTVWDKSGPYPILKNCDKAAQQTAQGI